MSKLIKKQLSTVSLDAPFIIPKSGLTIHLKNNITQLQERISKKNKKEFESIKSMIQKYKSRYHPPHTSPINELTLWEIANSRHPKNTLSVVMLNDKKLVNLFEDIQDLIRIAKKIGSAKVFSILLNENIRQQLFNTITLQEFIKITNRSGAKQILELVLEKKNFESIIHQLGRENFIKIASHDGSRQVFNLVLENTDFNILLDRLEKENFVKIACHSGSRKVLNLILNTQNYKTFLNQFEKTDLINIANTTGAHQTLRLFLDPKKYTTLVERLGKDVLIKIASKCGAKQVLDLILKDSSYKTLIDRLGKDTLIKVAGTEGSSQVLNLILDTDSFTTLMEKIEKENLQNISKKHGARQVFNLILNKENFEKLIKELGIENFLKIATHSGARQVLDSILDKKIYNKLLKEFKKEDILKIANTDGAKQIFDLILNKKNFEPLKKTLGEENFIKIGSQVGGKQVFDLILNHQNYETLIERVGKIGFLKIACTMGARNTLDLILNKKIFTQLVQILGENNLINIASHSGSKYTLDILADKDKYACLLTRLGKLGLKNLANHDGSQNTLNLILNDKTYALLLERLGKENLLKIGNHNGSKQVYDLFLNTETYTQLINLIGKKNLLNIANHDGAKNTLSLFQDKKIFETLVERLGKENVIKLANQTGSKQTLDLILDKETYDQLVEQLGIETLIIIACQPVSSKILKVFSTKEPWNSLKHFFDKKTLIKLSNFRILRLSLIYMMMNHKSLSKYFTPNSLYKYCLIPRKNQKGLNLTSLEKIFSSFNFTENEVLTLGKLSGRFIPYILDLFEQHTTQIESLFTSPPSLSFETTISQENTPTQIKISSLKYLTKKENWFINLVELNQFCKMEALNLDELFFLKNIKLSNISEKNHFSQIKELLQITGVYPTSKRKKIWNLLLTKNYLQSKDWISRLNSLEPTSRKWFIKKGEEYILSLIPPIQNNPYTSKDQLKLMYCLKSEKIRNYITQSYLKVLSHVTDIFQQPLIIEKKENYCLISRPDQKAFHPLEWIHITIKIYNSIDALYNTLEHIGNDSFELEYTRFTISELKEFKEEYPKFILKEGKITTHIKKEFLTEILSPPPITSEDLTPKTSSLKNPRKRPSITPIQHISKRQKINIYNLFLILKDFSKSPTEWEWHNIEMHLKNNHKNSTQLIKEAIQQRPLDEIPASIKGTLTNFQNPLPPLPNIEKEYDQTNFFEILNNADWELELNKLDNLDDCSLDELLNFDNDKIEDQA